MEGIRVLAEWAEERFVGAVPPPGVPKPLCIAHVAAATLAIALSSVVFGGCRRNSADDGLRHVSVLLDWTPQMERIGFIVADARGYYRNAGLAVTMEEGQGAITTAALVGAGKYPLGIATGGATIIARSRGAKVVSLALINQHSPTVIFAPASSGIRTPSDLVGKRIGLVRTGVKYDEYCALMNKLGIDRSMITEVEVGKSVASVLGGTVDAMLGYTEDQPVLAELAGEEIVRIPIDRYGIGILSTNIIANERYLRWHADICRAFVEASLHGWRRAVERPEEAVMFYLERYPGSDEQFMRENFRRFIPILFSRDVDSLGLGVQTLAGFQQTEQLLFDLGITKVHVSPAAAFTNRLLPRIKVHMPSAFLSEE